ncbi:MFS general substrate transporter [Stipitochalara longipes BDJ]|nr:MFS general substrate transporter [Stipitochalara longipes BDJ]
MSQNTGSDAEVNASTTFTEKTPPDAITSNLTTFDIDSEELPKGYYRSGLFLGTVVAQGLAVMAGAGTFALASPLLGVINADIGPNPNYVWVGLVYILMFAVGQLLIGRLSDLFGRRWFFIGGTFLGLIGCIISAVATSIPMLIGGTAILGFAAAAQLAYTFVLGELIPFKYRFMICSFASSSASPFAIFGPAISYAYVQHTRSTWRTCYYTFIGVNVVSLIFWILFYFPPTFDEKWAHKKSKYEVIKNIDYIGLVLFSGGLLVFLMGISWGGSYYSWNSAHVIGTIVVGIVSLVAFVLYEIYVPLKEPLIPINLFLSIPWVADIMLVALGSSVYFAFAIIWPIMVFGLYTSNLTHGGWLCCISGGAAIAGQITGGLLSKKVGKQKYQLIVMCTLTVIFLGACACATPYNQNTVIVLLFLGTFFNGWADSVGLTITSLCIPSQAEIGTAVGVGASLRSTVSTIATTIYTAVLSNRLGHTIPTEVPPKLIAAGLPASSVEAFLSAVSVGTPEAFSKVAGLTSAIQAVGVAAYKVASSHAYQTVFYTTIAFSTLGLVCAFLCPNVDELMTGKVVATLHKHKHEDEETAEK